MVGKTEFADINSYSRSNAITISFGNKIKVLITIILKGKR